MRHHPAPSTVAALAAVAALLALLVGPAAAGGTGGGGTGGGGTGGGGTGGGGTGGTPTTAPATFNILTWNPFGAACPVLSTTLKQPTDPKKAKFAQGKVLVNKYPSSPYVWTPFVNEYKEPPIAKAITTATRRQRDNGGALDLHQMTSFHITAMEAKLDVGCPNGTDNGIANNQGKTWFLGYDGKVPGPMIRITQGTEVVMRMTNMIGSGSLPTATDGTATVPLKYYNPNITDYEPCVNEDTLDGSNSPRKGHPITTHFHGSDSVAPYDGWAMDETCYGESKDYIYPNNKANSGWFHDHALDITSVNVYKGLATYYITDPLCGKAWNLDNIPEHQMIFADKVLNDKCELYYDRSAGGVHTENLFGDLVLVNGIPWPVMTVDPSWQHFRWLDGGPSRPLVIRIIDDTGADISSKVCWIIGGDDGYRVHPEPFLVGGLPIGVAERMQVVCDFSAYPGRSLYIINDRDSFAAAPANKGFDPQNAVPFFCYSHLLVKINVKACSTTQTWSTIDDSYGSIPKAYGPFPPISGSSSCYIPESQRFTVQAANVDPNPPMMFKLDQVYDNDTVKSVAIDMVKNHVYHRVFEFGHSGGGNAPWTVNGRTWFDPAGHVEASIGQNEWEVWELVSGGGWFHPVHIHLVGFYVIARNDNPALVPAWQQNLPKDVVFLYPASNVSLLIRFGPHLGEYMFHCHNLVHEDNIMMRAFSVDHVADSVITSLSSTGQTTTPLKRTGPMPTRLFDETVLESNNKIYDTYYNPMTGPAAAKPTFLFPPIDDLNYIQDLMAIGLHTIFYPTGNSTEDPRLSDFAKNPWMLTSCPAGTQPVQWMTTATMPPSPSPPAGPAGRRALSRRAMM